MDGRTDGRIYWVFSSSVSKPSAVVQTSSSHVGGINDSREWIANSEWVVGFPVVPSVVDGDVVKRRQLCQVVCYRLPLVRVSRHQGVLAPVKV